MAKLTIRDREIIIAHSAMIIMLAAINRVSDEWRPEDLATAWDLFERLRKARAKIYERREPNHAETAD